MKKRILIVDDHPVVRRGLMETLEDGLDGFDFGEASSAREALEQVTTGDWDMVVLDLTLPGRNGLEALKDIKALRPELPVLILTIHPEEQYAVRVLKAGAAGFLSKESAPEELITATKKVLAGERYVSASLGERLASKLALPAGRTDLETLSDREFQILGQLARGKSGTLIGKELSLSVKTVSTYRSRILEKLGLKTNTDLVRFAIEHGMV